MQIRKVLLSVKYNTDSLALRDYAAGKQKAVIIGGGVLGLEAADALQELGIKHHCFRSS